MVNRLLIYIKLCENGWHPLVFYSWIAGNTPSQLQATRLTASRASAWEAMPGEVAKGLVEKKTW